MKNDKIVSKFDEFWYKPKFEENLMKLEVKYKYKKIRWNLMNYEVKINVKKIRLNLKKVWQNLKWTKFLWNTHEI